MRSKKRKKSIAVLILVLLLGISVCCGVNNPIAVMAEDAEVFLSLNTRNPEENVPFEVYNMLPGDSVTRIFNVKAVYQTSAAVYFDIVVRPGDEKLAEVLKCKVMLADTENVLYDGALKDMPANLEYDLPTVSAKTEAELEYEITVYLDTSVGNEYQNLSLTADFVWWLEGEEGAAVDISKGSEADTDNADSTKGQDTEAAKDSDAAETGDVSGITLWSLMALCTGVSLAVAGLNRKYEVETNEK